MALTKLQDAAIRRMLRDGLSRRKIAKYIGCSERAIESRESGTDTAERKSPTKPERQRRALVNARIKRAERGRKAFRDYDTPAERATCVEREEAIGKLVQRMTAGRGGQAADSCPTLSEIARIIAADLVHRPSQYIRVVEVSRPIPLADGLNAFDVRVETAGTLSPARIEGLFADAVKWREHCGEAE